MKIKELWLPHEDCDVSGSLASWGVSGYPAHLGDACGARADQRVVFLKISLRNRGIFARC